MIIRKSQATTPLDRPFPDENTVSEMYCNEAYPVDNEAVEDWTSSLQMLLTFAAIFSAVLITLIVDSKTLLEQDKTEVLVDAVVFLMNNLANGTHRPYTPPSFQPSTLSVLVNCFFFASLCLSIATALAAVLAMQWVTDYGAVTRRGGSMPEERVKRRHFRYQGGQDWKMDIIIGSLPIALHLSVLLFFIGLIAWMWDVHHSVFSVVVVCGAAAALFYLLTTILAIFYPSCPYRTPLASSIYTLFHLVAIMFSRFGRVTEQGGTSASQPESTIRRYIRSLRLRFSQPSLTSRDDTYIRNPDKGLMLKPLVWLSNQIAISPNVYRRLLVLVDGFSSAMDSGVEAPAGVPWADIYRGLGTVYQTFVQAIDLDEDEFTEFARRTHGLVRPKLRENLESCFGQDDVQVNSIDFPIRLLHAWTESVSSHTSDSLRKQRYSDEVVIQRLVRRGSRNPDIFLMIWYRLLSDETATCDDILPQILDESLFDAHEISEQRLAATLYVISTRSLPWASTVPYLNRYRPDMTLPTTQLSRRLRVMDWMDYLRRHPQSRLILKRMAEVSRGGLLIQRPMMEDETSEFKQTRLFQHNEHRLTRPEAMLYSALCSFDALLTDSMLQGGLSTTKNMVNWVVGIVSGDLKKVDTPFDSKYFIDQGSNVVPDISYSPMYFVGPVPNKFRDLSNPILRLIACATLGIDWKEEWLSGVLESKKYLHDRAWMIVSLVCLRDPPFFDGDYTSLWRLRLQLWIHFGRIRASVYLPNSIFKLSALKKVESELQLTQLGIDHAGDFLLAFIHLNLAYGWAKAEEPCFTFAPYILTDDTLPLPSHPELKNCIDHFSPLGDEINSNPSRLIRIMIELIRADINHNSIDRWPRILLHLLKHAITHIADKDLRPFSPSCRRLTRYIKVSYKQFESDWDPDLGHGREDEVVRTELKVVFDEVVTLLGSAEGPWDGEVKDISWPRHLLRPTGTKGRPFEEDDGGESDPSSSIRDGIRETGEGVLPTIEEAHE